MSNILSLNFPKLQSKEKFSFRCFFIFILWSLISETYSATLLTPIVSIALTTMTLAIALIGLTAYCSDYKLAKISRNCIFLFLYLLIIGFLQGFSLTWGVIDIDFRYSLLFIIGAVFASSPVGMQYFHAVMKVLGIFSIAFGFLGIVSFFQEGYELASRVGTWTQSYFYWWASCSTFAYWGYYALFCKKDRLIGYSVVLLYFILGMLFLKRIALVNILVMLLIYVINNKNNRIRNSILLAAGIIGILFTLYSYAPTIFDNVWDALMGRFEKDQEINAFDRAEEANGYFENATIFQIVFGNGIGHHVPSPLWQGETILSLHMGWINFLFKGGIVYFLFMIVLFFKIFRCFYRKRIEDPHIVACSCVAFSFIVSLFIEGGWGNTLVPFCISAPIFYSYNRLNTNGQGVIF